MTRWRKWAGKPVLLSRWRIQAGRNKRATPLNFDQQFFFLVYRFVTECFDIRLTWEGKNERASKNPRAVLVLVHCACIIVCALILWKSWIRLFVAWWHPGRQWSRAVILIVWPPHFHLPTRLVINDSLHVCEPCVWYNVVYFIINLAVKPVIVVPGFPSYTLQSLVPNAWANQNLGNFERKNCFGTRSCVRANLVS